MDRPMIPVLWHAQPDGRGFYNSSAMLNWMFDQYPCKHYGVSKEMVELNGAGAVVVVHGGRELDGLDRHGNVRQWHGLIPRQFGKCGFHFRCFLASAIVEALPNQRRPLTIRQYSCMAGSGAESLMVAVEALMTLATKYLSNRSPSFIALHASMILHTVGD